MRSSSMGFGAKSVRFATEAIASVIVFTSSIIALDCGQDSKCWAASAAFRGGLFALCLGACKKPLAVHHHEYSANRPGHQFEGKSADARFAFGVEDHAHRALPVFEDDVG